MVCRTCQETLFGTRPRVGSRTALYVIYKHHKDIAHLEGSATDGNCFICRKLWSILVSARGKGALISGEGAYLTASIKRDEIKRNIFHLEFKFHRKAISTIPKSLATFILVEQSSTRADARLTTRPVSDSTAAPAVFDIARKWITECEQNHASCRKDTGTFHPTRLLYVAPHISGDPNLRLAHLVSAKKGEEQAGQEAFDGPYLTLSHCWGKQKFERLTKKTLRRFQEGLYPNDLPLTFREAITVTRSLDVRWIWIDALCIVQDDEQDWLRESAAMRQVYAHSRCNISATAADDSTKGLFRTRNSEHEWTSTITLKFDGEEYRCLVLDLAFWEDYVVNAPVNRRSWVLQERLLSPRVLHWCKDQIAFECPELDSAECRPRDLPNYHKIKRRLVEGSSTKKIDPETGKSLRDERFARGSRRVNSRWRSSDGDLSLKLMVQEALALQDSRWDYYEHWKRIVEDYTTMQLTKHEDRLIALSGVARLINDQIGARSPYRDDYLAGLWRGDLAGQLLWYVNQPQGTDSQPYADWRPKDDNGRDIYRAPSFSWASVEAPQGISCGDPWTGIPEFSVELVRLVYRNQDDNFGIVTDGYIVLRGVLRRVMMIDRRAYTEPSRAPRLIYLQHWLRQASKPWIGERAKKLHLDPPRTRFLLLSQALLLITVTYINHPIWAASRILLVFLSIAWFIFTFATLRPAIIDDHEPPQESRNRWAWRLLKQGEPSAQEHSIVWLDSPASKPNIFGKQANVFVVPALKKASECVICLLVQQTDDGDYGPRYKRIGLTKISTLHKGAMDEIIVPPGRNTEIKGAQYTWIADKDAPQANWSSICII